MSDVILRLGAVAKMVLVLLRARRWSVSREDEVKARERAQADMAVKV